MAEYKDITSIKEHIAHVKRNARSENSAYLIGYISALSTVEGMIESLPAADVVEVVRCKDCKRYRNHPNGLCYAHTEPCGTGYKGETICVEPDDYCSCGERKEVQE